MEPETLVGSIIQVRPMTEIDNCWRSVLMVVEEVKKWGVVAFAMTPKVGEKDMAPGRFYMRLNKGQYKVCGTATYLPNDVWEKLSELDRFLYLPMPVEGS